MSVGRHHSALLTDLRRRIYLYSLWDERLWMRTRFFGAAAVTNAALWELFSKAAGRVWLKGPALRSLTTLGCILERLNIHTASRIEADAIQGADLDEVLVATEQAAVESMLRRLKSTDSTGHAVTLSEMNRLLAFSGSASAGSVLSFARLFSSGLAYHVVLARVEQQLCRPPSFALQSDRERIGLTLIRLLRWEPAHTLDLEDRSGCSKQPALNTPVPRLRSRSNCWVSPRVRSLLFRSLRRTPPWK